MRGPNAQAEVADAAVEVVDVDMKVFAPLIAFASLFVWIAEADARARTFNRPTLLGDRLSACYGSGGGCGKPVADAYCISRGYENALSYRLNRNTSSNRARTLDNQIVSVNAKTPEFVFVKCYSSDTADKR
ncbi:MAG: hypothetical protein ACR2OJ_03620 [Hyphomicrobiales bacterium]